MSLHRKISAGIFCLIICQACVLRPRKSRSPASQVIQAYTQLYATLCYKHRTHGQGRVRITLHLQTDHCIWFSITTLWGLELVRGKMTPEQVALLYPMRKAYTICSYQELQQQWPGPWSYTTIQALLLGKVPEPQSATSQSGEQLTWQYQYDKAIDQVTQLFTKTSQGPLKVSYSHFKPMGLVVWKKVLLEAYGNQPNQPLMTVTLNQHKSKVSQGPIKAPFDIPEHYVPK